MQYVLDSLAAAGGVLISAAVLATLRAALLARDTARLVKDWVAQMPAWRSEHQAEHRGMDQRLDALEKWQAAVDAGRRGRGRHTLGA